MVTNNHTSVARHQPGRWGGLRQERLTAPGDGSVPPVTSSERLGWLVCALLGLLVVTSAGVILVVDAATFAVVNPLAWVGVETASAFARLFGALILLLFPAERAGQRFHWLAAGFVVLGLGGLVFGYLARLPDQPLGLNASMYGAVIVWTIAGTLFAIGLIPRQPPRFSSRAIAITIGVFGVLSLIVLARAQVLPRLITIDDLAVAAERGDAPLRGLTVWHWLFSTFPLLLALAALVGAVRHRHAAPLGGWLVGSMVLLAGSQLHNLLWPSAFSPVLTTANLLRLAFAATVVVGGVLELQRIAAERHAYAQRMTDLARLKADFTAMVAHELASPVAAIRGYAEVLAVPDLDEAMHTRAVAAIQRETQLLDALVADVRASAAIEREDFQVVPQPVLLRQLLDDATSFARTLPGAHPVSVEGGDGVRVRADRERIGQVLRNLLSNAAKYAPDGTTITLRASESGNLIRIEVIDQGHGIHPDDLVHIFEKFERGRDASGHDVAGVGLGLYLSQGIVNAHGSHLTVASTVGEGSVFAFTLAVVR